jgi:hypothetical protein
MRGCVQLQKEWVGEVRGLRLGLHPGSLYIAKTFLAEGYPQPQVPCRVQGAQQ